MTETTKRHRLGPIEALLLERCKRAGGMKDEFRPRRAVASALERLQTKGTIRQVGGIRFPTESEANVT